MKRKIFREPVFDSEILVLIGGTEAEADAVIGRYLDVEIESANGYAASGYAIHKDNRACLWIEQFDNTPDGWGIISHEIYHVAKRLLTRVSAFDCDETPAHFIGWLTSEIYKWTATLKKRRR